MRKYRSYLEDQHFVFRKNSQALTWLQRTNNQWAKLSRWALFLQNLNFRIEHNPGQENHPADSLAQQPSEEPAVDPFDADRIAPPSLSSDTLAAEVVAAEREVPPLREYMARLQHAEFVPPQLRESDLDRRCTVQDDILRRRVESHQLYVPDSMRPRILNTYHDAPEAGHPGVEETLRAVERRFHWSISPAMLPSTFEAA